MIRPLIAAGLVFIAAAPAAAQVPQPGQAAERRAAGDDEVPSFETVVVGPRSEGERVGAYHQPMWTTRRRFPGTRVYVRPPGDVEVEYWLENKIGLAGGDPRWRQQLELEAGLGHRLQLDLYLTTEQFGTGPLYLHEQKLELRWALADWGVIPANPTLYVEFVRQNDAPYKLEVKALFGGSISPLVHWGLNLVVERELGDHFEHEYALTGGLAYALVDGAFSIGVEGKFESVDRRGRRLGLDAWELMAGPSIQWLPVPRIHFDLVVPIGVEHQDGATTGVLEPLAVLGIEI